MTGYGRAAGAPGSIADDFDAVRGVHSIIMTAMMAPMIMTASTGLPILAIVLHADE